MSNKLVNGRILALTPSEEVQRSAEQSAWAIEKVARDVEQSRLDSLQSAIANDGVIQSLKTMNAAQFDAWWDANVTNAAQAIGVLKRLVKIIVRKLL